MGINLKEYVHNSQTKTQKRNGLLLEPCHKATTAMSELETIVGRKTFSFGVALTEINGNKCSDSDQIYKILHEATKTKRETRLVLCVGKHANLSFVDQSKCKIRRVAAIPGSSSKTFTTKVSTVVTKEKSKKCVELSAKRRKLLPANDSAVTNIKHKSLIGSSGHYQCEELIATSQVGEFTLPRKSVKKRNTLLNNPSTGNATNETSTKFNTNISEPIPSLGRKVDYKPYHVSFDPSLPLGFYCITDKSKKTCRIVSVCPASQSRRDPRIQIGTCVQSAVVGVDSYSVKGHLQLKHKYVLAKKEEKKLQLTLVNSKVKASLLSMYPNDENNTKWTNEGAWRGKQTHGWTGGAVSIIAQRQSNASNSGKVIHKTSSIPVQHSRLEKEKALDALQTDKKITTNFASSGKCRNALASCGRGDDGEWKLVNAMRPVKHHFSKPSRSLLIRSTSNRKNKKVNFATSFQTRFYEKGSKSVEALQMASGPGLVLTKEMVTLVPIGKPIANVGNMVDVVDAVHNGTYKDLIRLLQKGAAKEQLSSKIGLQKELSFVKERLNSLEKNYTGSRFDEKKLKDYQFKQAVMKIFANTAYQITSARNLKKWCRYEIAIEKICNLRVSNAGRLRHLSIISGRVSASHQPLGPLPSCAISETVEYDHNNLPTYHMQNNSSMWQEMRSLTIELLGAHSSEQLGVVTISLDEVDRKCPRGGKSGKLEAKVTTGNMLESATVILRLRIVDLKPDYLTNKRKEHAQKLHDIIFWIKTLNHDIAEYESQKAVQLTSHICAEGNVSLLHAAIYFEVEDAVGELLLLGADVHAKSCVGSPSTLAANMADRVAEMVKENEINDIVYEKKQASRSLQRACIERIVALLRQHNPSPASERTQSTIQIEKTYSESKSSFDSPFALTSSLGANNDKNRPDLITDVGNGRVNLPGVIAERKFMPLSGNRGFGRGIERTRPAWMTRASNIDCASLVVSERVGEEPNLEPETVQERGQQLGATPVDKREESRIVTREHVSIKKSVHLTEGSIINHDDHSAETIKSLPILQNIQWVIVGGNNSRQLCVFTRKNSSCHRGKNCPYVHVQPSWGGQLDKQVPPSNRVCKIMQRNSRVLSERGSFGDTWYTAGCHDKDKKIIHYAEGGGGAKSNQGLTWYESKKKALAALMNVMSITNFNECNRN